MLKPELSWTTVGAAVGLYLVYWVLQAFYRAFFHPLSKFPGPFLASITYKYEWYFDGYLGGQYTNKIAELHEQYGPIIRINPEELHCNDPAFIDTLYTSGNKRRHKSQYFLRAYGPVSSMGGSATADHDHHKLRRRAVDRFFSKQSIAKTQGLIHELSQKLCNRLLEVSEEPFDITNAYSCFTTDVVTGYCLGQKKGLLDQGAFLPNLRNAIIGGCRMLPTVRQWPNLFGLVQRMPDSVANMMSSDIAGFNNNMKVITEDIRKIVDAYKQGREKEVMESQSIFIDILESDLPPSEKTVPRLGTEATTMISAGTETTAWTLTVLTVYLKEHPEMLAKLTAELKTIVKDPKNLPPWAALEQLPYLSAICLEGIRLSYGVATRLARIAPDEVLMYKGTFRGKDVAYAIPKGTPTGMSSALMNVHPQIFPDGHSFIPDRWLNKDGSRRHNLEPYLLSFSKGSRQCLGMNLAYCELYVSLAALVLRVFPHLELYKTSHEDIEFNHDNFVAGVKPDSQGVRVIIK